MFIRSSRIFLASRRAGSRGFCGSNADAISLCRDGNERQPPRSERQHFSGTKIGYVITQLIQIELLAFFSFAKQRSFLVPNDLSQGGLRASPWPC
jgi:hypothetical protein